MEVSEEKLQEVAEVKPEALKELLLELAANIKEEILLELPKLAARLMRNEAVLWKAAQDFYADSPELVEHKAVCEKVISELAAKDPSMTLEALFKEAKAQVKDVIKLQQEAIVK